MKILFAFLIVISSLLASSASWAVMVNARVRVKNQIRYLQVSPETPLYEIRPLTQEASRNLERLVDNDVLRGQGEFSGDLFLLQSLDFVGLSHLLGAWHSIQDQSMVTFEDYSTLSVLNPRTLGLNRMVVFDYSVAPDRGDQWRMFVTGTRNVAIANMQLQPTRMILQFINLETGALEPPLELVRKSP